MTALTDAVETLKYLYKMTQRKFEVALHLLMLYENALTAGIVRFHVVSRKCTFKV